MINFDIISLVLKGEEMFTNLLNAKSIPVWIDNSFPVIQNVLLCVIALCSLLVIIAVLRCQSNPDGGTNAITGISDSYYMHNKGNTKEGRLQKLIIISVSLIFVLTIIYFVLELIMNSFV